MLSRTRDGLSLLTRRLSVVCVPEPLSFLQTVLSLAIWPAVAVYTAYAIYYYVVHPFVTTTS